MNVLTITYHPGQHFSTELEVLEVARVDGGMGAWSVETIGIQKESILRVY